MIKFEVIEELPNNDYYVVCECNTLTWALLQLVAHVSTHAALGRVYLVERGYDHNLRCIYGVKTNII